MVISYKNKYIFIEIPKTGTTSIRQFLVENDPSATQNRATINGKTYEFKIHMKARQVRDILGPELYREFRVFAFIRDPYERVVSKYFYFNQMTSTKKRSQRQTFGTLVRSATASVLPLQIWSIVFPYDGNIEYLVDKKGDLIVDHIGLFENINEDFKNIINRLQLNLALTKLTERNKSSYTKGRNYFSNKMFNKLMHLTMKKDIIFYNKQKELLSKNIGDSP